MQKLISTEQIPIKLWLDDIESGALEQAKNLANLPFAFKHIAIMPDAHQGYGMPIGGVMATDKVIVPNAVGVDIGCGMCAVKTSLTEIQRDKLVLLVDQIRRVVPVGFEWHKKPQDIRFMPSTEMPGNATKPIAFAEFTKARHQIGTLGGGNHFIEIQKGSDGFIWIMVHSGSRNIGKKVADHYNNVAKKLNEKWFSSIPLNWQLAFLPMDSEEGKLYRSEMEYCVDFALANRKLIVNRIRWAITEVIGGFSHEPIINIAHNYAAMESHFGKNVMVHRKGATMAKEGLIGIIPGSQGSKSYIVRGKGNPQSFMSCSHGAGRKMGRKEASRTLDLAEQQSILDSQGIIHGISNEKDLDEAPGAYKSIDEVMRNQADLVDIEVELTPLAVIKS